jgi:phosphocarrier protein
MSVTSGQGLPPDQQSQTSSAEFSHELVELRVKILNRLGLHARPAMSFVDTANAFESDIRVGKGDQQVDGKSIMQMMMLAATQGTELLIRARGPDARAAVEALRGLVERKFDEE